MFQQIMTSLGVMTGEPPAGDLGESYPRIKEHVLNRIRDTEIGKDPFYFCFIESVFPDDFYESLRAHMLSFKGSERMQARTQDNPEFVNRRYNLVECSDLIIRQFRAIFNDSEIRIALFSKFYSDPHNIDLENIRIHKEFEYVFCEPNRFQNIHVDIPPKFMSFVFYIPENEVDEDAEKKNATVLYDKELKPRYGARFRKNSVCIFVPHFYSYHGFASTMERDVLVMFYIHAGIKREWRRATGKDGPRYDGLLSIIEKKLLRYPLIEYGADLDRIKSEREACRVNAPQGRVMVD